MASTNGTAVQDGLATNKVYYGTKIIPTMTGTFEFANGEKIERGLNGLALGTGPETTYTEEKITYQWIRRANSTGAWDYSYTLETTAIPEISPTDTDALGGAQYQLIVRGYHAWETPIVKSGDTVQIPAMEIRSNVLTAAPALITPIYPTFGTLKVGMVTLANSAEGTADSPWYDGIVGNYEDFTATCVWIDTTDSYRAVSDSMDCRNMMPKDKRGFDVTPLPEHFGHWFAVKVILTAKGYLPYEYTSGIRQVQNGSFENTAVGPMQVRSTGSYEAYSDVQFTLRMPDINPWTLTDNDGEMVCKIYATTNVVDPANPTYTWSTSPVATIDDCGDKATALNPGAEWTENWVIPGATQNGGVSLVGKAFRMEMTAQANEYETRVEYSIPAVVIS
ncbi:hypothetical protein FACS1894125_7380 [Actinomycetota bacterium]|nr:hypothetical protein FACS1894125_7380 [Actinomycetota bacterium]